MTCPRCHAPGMPGDPFCLSCRTSFGGGRRGGAEAVPGTKPPLANRIGMVFGLLGACVGQVVASEMFQAGSDDRSIIIRAACAGVGAAVLGTIGYAIVGLFNKSRD